MKISEKFKRELRGVGGETEKEEKTKGRKISEQFSLTSLKKTNYSINLSNFLFQTLRVEFK